MNTLNWEKLPTFKTGKTLWGDGGKSTSSLSEMLGSGKTLDLDISELEGMFAKPEVRPRAGSVATEDTKPKISKVTLLDAKRSTSVGIVMKRITDALQGKELRDALMEVDENLLPLEVRSPSSSFVIQPSLSSLCSISLAQSRSISPNLPNLARSPFRSRAPPPRPPPPCGSPSASAPTTTRGGRRAPPIGL